MKRSPIKLNTANCPETLAAFCGDSAVFDSSCSPTARVFFIDKDEGYFLKTIQRDELIQKLADFFAGKKV